MDFLQARPFQVITMAIFGVLALIGLYFFATFNGFSGGGTSTIGEVVIWGTLPQQAVDQALDTARASDRSFDGVSYTEYPAETFGADLSEAIAEGRGPDMVLLSQEELFAERAKLELIPYSSISERDYIDAFIEPTEILMADEGVYGIPVVVDPLLLFYNRTLLSYAGAASPPQTWEAATGLAPRLTVRGEGGSLERSALAFGEYDNVDNARAVISLLLLQAGVPITITTPGGIQASLTAASDAYGAASAESALNFFAQFADPLKTVYSWNRVLPPSREAFVSGDLAFYLGFASELPYMQAANPNLNFDITAVPSPQTVEGRITYGRTYAFAIPRASFNKEGALTAAMQLSEGDAAYALAVAGSLAPASKELLGETPGDRFSPIIYGEALRVRSWLSPSPSETDGIFSTMIEDIATGRRDTSDALDAAEGALNAAL
jgi:ABC-type glycerol-3-phosphate transport system substrate-binding protein